ncbi:hypothetical protein EYD45_02355 [Hyunsoonleella flava]|uniref:Lipocalin-like domain-containing protein n=1 Tax=Hyunsoonleella flava TaxID=2527939 RepID=A0A4V2JAH5_9FLAO|nr:hypothetical protein [Hyunsoonleella flava]TBN06746.1 hypothetical protein EYD45_02355 [Hyunsoonleella flava]
MKKILYFTIIILLFNCASDDGKPNEETQLLGKWQVIEHLLDPGDGSGTFKPVTSQRVIEFFLDGSVKVNGNLCFLTTEIGEKQTGTYEITSNPNADTTFDGEIIPDDDDCNSEFYKIYFDISADGHLILWYPCIEPCGEKFKKVD